MIGENIHEHQTIADYKHLASLKETDSEGNAKTAQIVIIVINDFKVEIDTCGRSRKAFQSLRDDVNTRLLEAGYTLNNLNFGDL